MHGRVYRLGFCGHISFEMQGGDSQGRPEILSHDSDTQLNLTGSHLQMNLYGIGCITDNLC